MLSPAIKSTALHSALHSFLYCLKHSFKVIHAKRQQFKVIFEYYDNELQEAARFSIKHCTISRDDPFENDSVTCPLLALLRIQ